ncbi:AraC-like DNA-binding protein [Thermosporothrix hazakensis]|jgi:AraC-like DNA-binding protein|uniref:AraC-like DNA-binding protein n=1 Tax=Thermosporothrix hazakensis TaxID=644383 RepID=A0A326UBL9_THEHA|nr:AraC family transcriptional regulator [Thermosporothrix hazakensis]PZW34422.1 AraC-like DNA-binding protein [Thermosporothrix hazakensis]GCE46028.1 AraC family transcriptional regulator [Thermosporothrix hazakensis]
MSETQADLRETHIVGADTDEQMVGKQACPALGFYRIQLTGISKALPPFRFVRVRPSMSQILVCLSGCGSVLIDGQWTPCTRGMAYVTPPDCLHAYHAESAWEICWITYNEDPPGQPMVAVKRPTLLEIDPYPLAASIEGLYREYIGAAEQAVMQQWTQLIHIHAQRIVGPVHMERRLQQLWERVNADIAAPWTNERLAAKIGISSEQLRRLCQHYLGRSPMKHVTLLRMRRAITLLASEYYTIEEISERVGYENPFAFSTAFKRLMGISPSQYRRQLHQ